MIITNTLLPIERLEKHEVLYPEIKDPSIVHANGFWHMFASVGRSSDQQWIVGRFQSQKLEGPWKEVDPVEFVGISGPQLCAPAVMFDQRDNTTAWNMYIQTACFEENGVIAEAHSTDGRTFSNLHASLMSKEHINPANRHKVVGLYDAGISNVRIEGKEYTAMIFSGYRKVGSGDIYLTLREKNNPDANWTPPVLILEQENVPFHNNPTYDSYEWGLEGGKIEQIDDDLFLLVGVCFLPLPRGEEGKRQRVFFAASHKIDGPYIPLGTPFPPQKYDQPGGEHGHPDAILDGKDFIVIYQERKGDFQPWHLRYSKLDVHKLRDYARQTLSWSPLQQIHDWFTEGVPLSTS